MKYRVFIAILLPEDLKKVLVNFQKYFKELNIRWVKSENLHLTLLFLGWLEENQIIAVKKVLRDITSNFSTSELKLSQIQAGPNLKFPRMVWATGPTSPSLEQIYQKIKEGLANLNIPFDNRYSLKIHITLARARGGELKGKKIQESLNLSFPVREISLMQSQLKLEGAEYQILEKFPLKL